MPYLTPQSLPEGDDCRPLSIPANSEWLALFGGALTELTLRWNWEYSGGLTVDETLDKMTEIINDWYIEPCTVCTTPGGYRVVRIGTSGRLEQLDENGDWQPTTDDYALPAPAAREGGTTADQNCLAAKNATNVLQQLYESLSESWSSELSEAEAITEFVAVAIALIAPEFAIITWAIAAFFLLVFATLYTALEYLGADLWDENFTKQLECFLLDCAENDGGVVTFNWDCFNAHLNSLADSFELSEIQLRLYAQVGFILYFIGGADGLNLAGATTEITNDDCTFCDESWCYTWDFTLAESGWAVRPDIGIVVGHYVGGQGFVSDQYEDECSSHGYTYLFLNMGFTVDNISSVVVETSPAVDLSADFFDQMTGFSIIERTSVGASGTEHGAAVTPVSCDTLQIAFNACGVPAGYAVTRCTVSGTGANPFGDDNCP